MQKTEGDGAAMYNHVLEYALDSKTASQACSVAKLHQQTGRSQLPVLKKFDARSSQPQSLASHAQKRESANRADNALMASCSDIKRSRHLASRSALSCPSSRHRTPRPALWVSVCRFLPAPLPCAHLLCLACTSLVPGRCGALRSGVAPRAAAPPSLLPPVAALALACGGWTVRGEGRCRRH